MSTTPDPVRAEFDPSQYDLEYILYLELVTGRVVIKTYPEDAPIHVARVKELSRQGFYDGLKWHRVLPEFMAQTGDPQGDGTGGSGQNLKAEFNERHHLRGTVAMARGSGEDSADSQFFIMLLPKFALDGNYTIWGRVIDGMSRVDAIKKGSSGFHDGEVLNPDKIISMKVAADVEKDLPKKQYSDSSPKQPNTQQSTPNQSVDRDNNRTASYQAPSQTPQAQTYETTVLPIPLPQWPIEPPHQDTVSPPIPEGGYVPY